jgi:hypothetical protein
MDRPDHLRRRVHLYCPERLLQPMPVKVELSLACEWVQQCPWWRDSGLKKSSQLDETFVPFFSSLYIVELLLQIVHTVDFLKFTAGCGSQVHYR